MFNAPIRKNVCTNGGLLILTDQFKDWAKNSLSESCYSHYEKSKPYIRFHNEDDMILYLLTWTEEQPF